MDYAALSPHVGAWALRDDQLGNSSLRGGAFNWGNIGSRISSALSSTGRWLYNAGNRFVHSNTFNQIKQGLRDSGVVQNAAHLAGETLNALTDIGRLKLQQDLENLRRKALGEEKASDQGDLKALIAALQAQMAAAPAPSVAAPAPMPAAPPAPIVPPPPPTAPTVIPTPPPPTVPPPREQITSSAPASPFEIPNTVEYAPSAKRRRKRPAPGNWRSRLNTIAGTGVTTSRRRMCY
ncbi:pVI [Aviadenovirus phalacrocoracidae]|uniref:PVI n=1 Tax=Aviadenovirus sp. TaxID=2217649 RepID=A0ABZ0T3G4_9ADEN|nr:pVI [Aviadenovirus sp.]